MYEGMNDVEIILYIEKRFGFLSKTISGGWSIDKVSAIDYELKMLLQKFKNERGVKNQIPRIRSWTEENKVNFLFFDKMTGKRVLLGDWLSGKEGQYEH